MKRFILRSYVHPEVVPQATIVGHSTQETVCHDRAQVTHISAVEGLADGEFRNPLKPGLTVREIVSLDGSVLLNPPDIARTSNRL